MTNILLYPANVANFFRLLVFIFMVCNMKKNPFIAILSSIVSGLIDEFDGDLARHFKQTTKFGAYIDKAIDRATSTLMCCFLSSLYCKYWAFFFLYITLELTGDVINYQHMYYSGMVNLMDSLKIQDQNKLIESMRHDIYGFVGLKPVQTNFTQSPVDSTPPFNIHTIINPIVWYTSDLFFLFMYWGGLVILKYNQQTTTLSRSTSHKSLIINDSDSGQAVSSHHAIDLNNNFVMSKKDEIFEVFTNATSMYGNVNKKSETNLCFRLLNEIKNIFSLICFVFGELGDFIEKNINSKLIFFSFRVKKLKAIFRIVGFVCFLGMTIKFTRYFMFVCEKVGELVQVDMRLAQYQIRT
jgi:hypothetical protein